MYSLSKFYFFLSSTPLKGLLKKKKSIQRAPLELTCGLSMAFTTKKNQDSQEKWLIPNVGKKMGKMNLQHLVIQESKEAVKDYWNSVKEVRSKCEGTHYTKGQD